VVDRDQRQPPRGGNRLGGAEADQEGADQAGAGGHRDRLDVLQRNARFRQRCLDHRHRQLQMVARSHLGDDAAEAGVRLVLRGDHVGEDARPVDDGSAGVIAGGLDRENHELSPSTFSPST